MLSDSGSREHGMEESTTKETSSQSGIQPTPLPLFAVQLQNILPVEIVAKRFPGNTATPQTAPLTSPNAQLNIEEPTIDIEARQAQILMQIKVEPVDEPRLFEISLKLVGLFTYSAEYNPEAVRQFLQQGSLSFMLPFARELLFSLSTRLQIPLIVLPLVQLAPTPIPDTKTEDAPQ